MKTNERLAKILATLDEIKLSADKAATDTLKALIEAPTQADRLHKISWNIDTLVNNINLAAAASLMRPSDEVLADLNDNPDSIADLILTRAHNAIIDYEPAQFRALVEVYRRLKLTEQ